MQCAALCPLRTKRVYGLQTWLRDGECETLKGSMALIEDAGEYGCGAL